MTASDKTGEKLVDSMRKTKAAAADKDETAAGTKPGPARGTQAKRAPSRSGAKTATKRSPADRRDRADDPYQSGRRVWPD